MIQSLFCLALSIVLSSTAYADSKQSTKNKILKLSYKNMTNEKNRDQVRLKLNKLVTKLQADSSPVTTERIVKYSPGSWRQIWSDERDNSPPGAPQRDLSQVYQVVSEQGWGYNFGVRFLSPEHSVTYVLAAKASVVGNEQTTEITRSFYRPTGLKMGEALIDMANEIHSGKSTEYIETNAGQFPKGPIGAKAILTILYIDQDLKIGTAPNVYDGRSEMFVMHRQNLVVE
jgi:hypothetical protein